MDAAKVWGMVWRVAWKCKDYYDGVEVRGGGVCARVEAAMEMFRVI